MRQERAWVIAWSVIRFVVAAAIVAAVVGQLIRSVGISADRGWPVGATIVDFFSFFTIASNCGSVVALTIGGVIGLSRARVDPRWFAVLLACVSTYMLITGLVYNLLLRNIPLPQGSTVPWSNEILHVWAPLFLLLDVIVAPKRRVASWSTLGAVVVFPVVWVIYTLVRGPLVSDFRTGNDWWYPYPFLNPHLQAWGVWRSRAVHSGHRGGGGRCRCVRGGGQPAVRGAESVTPVPGSSSLSWTARSCSRARMSSGV